MNIISYAVLKTTNFAELSAITPAIITWNGEPQMIIAPCDSIVVISDLHPRVRAQLKAMETKARAGMPAPQKAEIPEIPYEMLRVKLDPEPVEV